MNRRYTMPARCLIVTDDIARDLALLLGPGRSSIGSHVARHPDLMQWLAELDEIAPHADAQAPVVTTWINTNEAAGILKLSPRQTRNLAGKIRSRYVDGRWSFDADDVRRWLPVAVRL
jgi:hypothetical protein